MTFNEVEFGRIKLAPDEVLVVRIPELGSFDAVALRDAVVEAVGTNRVMVVSGDVEFEVIKIEQPKATS